MRLDRLCAILLLATGPAAGSLAATEPPAIVVRPAAPPAPEAVAALRQWHGRWALALQPVLAAWRGAGRDLERWHRRGSAPGCRALLERLDVLDPAAFTPAPEYSLTRDADALLDRLGRGARACLVGRYFEASYELGEARGVYLGLVRRVGRYGLEP